MPHLTPGASPRQAESLKNAPEIISKPPTFSPILSTRHKNPNTKSTTHSHPPELSPRSVHHLPHNIISLYFLYLSKNLLVSLRYFRQLKWDNFNKIFSLREFLHSTPEEHKKICSKVSSSILQNGHEMSESYIFLKLALISYIFKGELQRENKLISYERAFKMLENDMYIAGIGQAILELLSFKVGSRNHQRGISLLQKFSDIFGNMRLVPLKMTSHLTSHNFQILKIEIFSKPC